MKASLLVLLMCLVAGCATMQNTPYTEIPRLLIQYPLPDITENIYRPNFNLNMLMLIDTEGNVDKVKFLSSSGDTLWDSRARLSVMKWKYSPARINNEAVPVWIKQTAFVEIKNPVFMNLEEILCKNKAVADSVYSMLLKGEDFELLAKKYSTSKTADNEGKLGTVNINLYPKEIRQPISRLYINGFTEPMIFGREYLIIKRLKNIHQKGADND